MLEMRLGECCSARPQAHVRPSVHETGGELEQIRFLLGHVSVQTTERYLGSKQRLRNAVNDTIGLEPAASLNPKAHAGRLVVPNSESGLPLAGHWFTNN